eukprot:TRINITY_DN154_c0_g4_i1.p1 TRINITY_DN154_c0_g4~~TRINITY_DN154_c0_g4_i1.p1  ORF type:complete len:370 (+),score=31.95 TRINITY_DN154_c0_g4_i1:24-1112(+)
MILAISCSQHAIAPGPQHIRQQRFPWKTNQRCEIQCQAGMLQKQAPTANTLLNDIYGQFLHLTEMPISEKMVDFSLLPPQPQVNQKLKWDASYELPTIKLPTEQLVVLVEDICQVDFAVKMLAESMTDNLLALEFEWRSDPIFADNNDAHKISMVTVASEQLCVLFRMNKLNYIMPKTLIEFLQSKPMMIGFSNRYQLDEEKFQLTFGYKLEGLLGQNKDSYIDLSILLMMMGFTKYNFRDIAEKMLGAPRIIKNVKRSDWEAFELTKMQIYSTAMDAFIQGQMLRQIRKKYLAKETCQTCKKAFGIRVFNERHMKCQECGKEFLYMQGYFQHCQLKGHESDMNLDDPVCEECMRYNLKENS